MKVGEDVEATLERMLHKQMLRQFIFTGKDIQFKIGEKKLRTILEIFWQKESTFPALLG